ncbi:MAG TPA: YpiB family protein [Bacillota bacterium]|nr:YpiB family protein [Bacillota bacterium]
MDDVITVTAKKGFIRWFLSKFHLKKKEGTWLFNYMLSDERLLEKVHFTENLKDKEKTIIISTICTGATPFVFQKATRIYYDVERAFHDIRLNPDEDVFISVFFRDRMSYSQYMAVLEGSPVEDQQLVQVEIMSLVAEIVMDQAIRKYKLKCLLQEIDTTLATGNKEHFLSLTKEWIELRKLEVESEG